MESQEYTVSVGNIVLGVYVFMILRLPPEWKLVRGGIPSEFVYSKELEGARWVTEGRAYHYLHNRSNGNRFQFTIKCVKGRGKQGLPRSLDKRGEGTIDLSGHACRYIWGKLRGGIFRKEELTYLNLSFTCDRTDRTVTLEMKGQGRQEDVRGLTEALGESKCHTV